MESNQSNGPPPETRTAIMDATYQALCEHGYANLTTQRIADELGKSSALLYYYYESKEDLLVAFLEYLFDQLRAKVSDETASAQEKLKVVIDTLFPAPDAANEFGIAMLEMKAQTPYNDAFRDQFQENDERMTELIEEIIRDGVDRGEFTDVDPTHAAETFQILIEGSRSRSVVLDDVKPRFVGREAIDGFLAKLTAEGDRE